eukprot:3600293-Rhodomonas_salina.1
MSMSVCGQAWRDFGRFRLPGCLRPRLLSLRLLDARWSMLSAQCEVFRFWVLPRSSLLHP